MSDSVHPHRWQPTRLPCPWDSPGKNTGVGCHFLLQCVKVKSESEVTQLSPTLSDPMDCSLSGHEIKRRLFLGKKAIINLDSILKSRDIILPTKWWFCKKKQPKLVFLVVMYVCEGWTIKKAECWIIVFELWCWRTFEIPLDCKKIKSILKKINPEYSLEELMLKLQYFGHLISWLIEKGPHTGKDWGQEEKRAAEDETVGWPHWLNGHEFEPRELVMDRKAWCAAVHVCVCAVSHFSCVQLFAVHGVAKSKVGLSAWTITTNVKDSRLLLL